MTRNYQVIRATVDNLDSIAAIFNSYRIFYEQPSDVENARNFIQKRLINNESVIFIALDDSEPATALGFIQLYPSFSSISMRNIYILNDLFVNENARKLGVASELMRKAEEFALQAGAKSLVLETATDNYVAQKLYESRGYAKDNGFYTYSLNLLS